MQLSEGFAPVSALCVRLRVCIHVAEPITFFTAAFWQSRERLLGSSKKHRESFGSLDVQRCL